MTPRSLAIIAGLLAAASALAPLAAAQNPEQMKKCSGGWEVEARDKVAACTALLDGKQLNEDQTAVVHYYRGEALKDLAQFDKALVDLNEAIRMAPDAAQPYAARGDLFANSDKYDEAIADFDKAIQLDNQDAYTFQQRGDAYEAKGAHAKAIADYTEALRLEPMDDFVLSARCRARAIWGQQLDEAAADCTQAIGLDDDNQYAYEQRGLVRLRQGQYAEAIADYGEALKKYDGRSESLYGRGIAKMRSGDADGGRKDIAAATRIEAGIAKMFEGWGFKP
jgi:tetratricopeptide (TPR) repeat protein